MFSQTRMLVILTLCLEEVGRAHSLLAGALPHSTLTLPHGLQLDGSDCAVFPEPVPLLGNLSFAPWLQFSTWRHWGAAVLILNQWLNVKFLTSYSSEKSTVRLLGGCTWWLSRQEGMAAGVEDGLAFWVPSAVGSRAAQPYKPGISSHCSVWALLTWKCPSKKTLDMYF